MLASDFLSEEEKDQLTDVVAYAKGAMLITKKMLAENSDVPKERHIEIEKKADAFVAGLEGEDKSEDEE